MEIVVQITCSLLEKLYIQGLATIQNCSAILVGDCFLQDESIT